MADQYILCLIGAMDHLWFNRIVLFSSEPTSLLADKTPKPPQPPTTSSESLTGLSSTSSLSIPEEEEEESSDSSPFTHLDDSNNEEEKKEMDLKQRRPTRLNLISDRARSHSSSPSTQKRHCPRRRLLRHYSDSTHSDSMVTLQKSTSFRSFCDLELQEVKGFIDLGFIFKKEDLSPRMMSVVPGLQRVGFYKNKHNPELEFDEASHEITNDDGGGDDENEQEEYEKSIIRPYLSEAWLIKRPDSPLLNLRMPRVSASADMKKHLRFWAKTVASTVNQEC